MSIIVYSFGGNETRTLTYKIGYMTDTALNPKVFEEIVLQFSGILPEDMRKWTYSKMIDELKNEIERFRKEAHTKNVYRDYPVRILLIKGEEYVKVKKWIDGVQPMTAEEIQLVLGMIGEWRHKPYSTIVPTRPCKTLEAILSNPPSTRSQEISLYDVTTGARRKFVEHAISVLNSLAGLSVGLEISKQDVFDGDRMQVVSAFRILSKKMGIAMKSSIGDSSGDEPLTTSELENVFKKSTEGKIK